MKVVHVTVTHRPFDARIFDRECRSLAAAGHEVVLLCPHDRTEENEGVLIRPLPSHSRRLRRMTLGSFLTCRAALAERADVYHLHDPELLATLPFLKRRARVIFDAHEDLPAQIATKAWIPALIRRPLASLMRRLLPVLLRFPDAVVAATPAIGETIGRPRVRIVQNHPRPDDGRQASPFSARDHSVAYIGGLNLVRGAEQLVDALGLLSESSALVLRFAGVFEPPSLERFLVGRRGWERVQVEGWLDKEEVTDLLGATRAGIVTFLPYPNHLRAQPNKLFEYMGAGLPVIASDFPLWREIIDSNRCGLLVDPRDPRSIADAMQYLTSNPEEAEAMGRRGREAVARTYNWATQERVLLELYEELACGSGS